MSTTTADKPLAGASVSTPNPKVARVGILAPLQWVANGFQDFRSLPGMSLLYGVLFAALCGGVYLLTWNAPWFTFGYLTGLMVIGPFLAAGLYAARRDIELGVKPGIASSSRLMFKRRTYLGLFSLMLALSMAAWIRFSALVFALKFNTLVPPIEAYTSLFSSTDGWVTLTYFLGIGLLLAAVAFIVSAVSIPLILDRDVDFITAMGTSARAVARNPGAMLLWAAIIVGLTAVGIATAFIGLALIFPVLGYATWHSYRALVR